MSSRVLGNQAPGYERRQLQTRARYAASSCLGRLATEQPSRMSEPIRLRGLDRPAPEQPLARRHDLGDRPAFVVSVDWQPSSRCHGRSTRESRRLGPPATAQPLSRGPVVAVGDVLTAAGTPCAVLLGRAMSPLRSLDSLGRQATEQPLSLAPRSSAFHRVDRGAPRAAVLVSIDRRSSNRCRHADEHRRARAGGCLDRQAPEQPLSLASAPITWATSWCLDRQATEQPLSPANDVLGGPSELNVSIDRRRAAARRSRSTGDRAAVVTRTALPPRGDRFVSRSTGDRAAVVTTGLDLVARTRPPSRSTGDRAAVVTT